MVGWHVKSGMGSWVQLLPAASAAWQVPTPAAPVWGKEAWQGGFATQAPCAGVVPSFGQVVTAQVKPCDGVCVQTPPAPSATVHVPALTALGCTAEASQGELGVQAGAGCHTPLP